MTKRIVLSVVLVAFFVAEADAQNRFHRRRGVILGGLAGAAVGAAIGDKGDNETAGALIGGAVGAIAGGAIGDQKDRRVQQQHHHAYQTQYYRQQLSQQQAAANWQAQQHAHQQHRAQQQAARALSNRDVVDLVRRGLGEATIIQYIQINGVQQRLGVADIISLHEQGVSEPIINAMQTAPVAPPVTFRPDGYPVPTHAAPINSATGQMDVQDLHGPASEVIVEDDHGYGQSIIVPPATTAPMIDPTKPYVFPEAR